MAENCKNCNELITGNFCINCGQKKYKRIDRKYVMEEVQYTFLHANKGLLYSAKTILKNPGKTARDFIDGNRVRHYKPILLTFVLSGLSAFLSYKVIGMEAMMRDYYSVMHMDSVFMQKIMATISSYMSLFMMILIPFFALATRIAFRKSGHNYYEHVVMNAYILSYYTLISIILIYPLMFIFRHSSSAIPYYLMQASVWITPLLLIWFFKGFYAEKSWMTIILKVLIILGLTLLGYLAFILLTGIVVMIYVMMNGAEALQSIQPR